MDYEKRKKILIIDDHRLFRESWALLLNNEEKFHVIGETGFAGLCVLLATRIKPDIVFMEINISADGGFELTRRVITAFPGSLFVAVSMHQRLEFAKRLFKLGVHGYVTKNSSMEEIKKCIQLVSKGEKYLCEEMKDVLAYSLLGVDYLNSSINHLSSREILIIHHLVAGHSSQHIADQFRLSVRTIEARRALILKKLKLKNTAALIHYFFSIGLQPLFNFEVRRSLPILDPR